MRVSEPRHHTRPIVVTLDPSAHQQRLLAQYCGARRFAYNWALGVVRDNLDVRRREREAGVAEDDLTPALSWSAYSLTKAFNAVKEQVAPWWREVSMHAFRSGITDAAQALENWSKSRKGLRQGRRVGFPRFKRRHRSVDSVSFVELNHQLSWLHPDRHHVRLMLPQSPARKLSRQRREQLGWIHTHESTRRAFRLVEAGKATIQKVTISKRGGRWQASILLRHTEAPGRPRRRRRRGLVAADAGISHLLTLSQPVPGLTDDAGHVANPRVLDQHLRRLRRLDRAIARCVSGSKNQARLRARRARLHGRITRTRTLELHRVTNTLVGNFEVVAVEDLNVAGMSNRKRRLGRHLADASLGELRRQLTYKTTDRGTTLVTVGRWFPSSKTCSRCGAVRAKLPLSARVFDCTSCGHTLDRDVNAALNIATEAARLLAQRAVDSEAHEDVAGLRPETLNADPRSCETTTASAVEAGVVRGRNQAATAPTGAVA